MSDVKYISLVLIFLVGACGSPPKNPGLEWYRGGLQAIEEGSPEKAIKLFEVGCKKGAKAACLQLGKEIAFEDLPKVSILQGLTTSNNTQLAIVLDKNKFYRFLVWESPGQRLLHAKSLERITRPESKWAVEKVSYEGLQAGRSYRIDVISPKGKLIDSRKFSALDLNKKAPRIAIASCMHDGHDSQTEMWPQVLSQKPDILFLIGDNVYADSRVGYNKPAAPLEVWERYAQTRNTLVLFKSPELVPTLAVWDDHDYGLNNGGRDYEFKLQSKNIFLSYYPQKELGKVFARGPGVASRFQAFGQVFYFMDNRSFRSPAKAKDQTHFGRKQEDWLFASLAQDSTPVWLISGDQWFGSYHRFESYEGNHPKSFKVFLTKLRKYQKTLGFISGDRHLTELMKIEESALGHNTYEVTSSGIHAKHYPGDWDKYPNKRQIAGKDMVDNYVILQSENVKGSLIFGVKAYGPERSLLFSRDLKIGN